jgi:acylphosphatase
MAKIRANLKVIGDVQSVTFRWFIQRKAKDSGLTGWVKNLPDGSVEAVIEGEKEKIEELVKKSRRGPLFAKVEDIRVDFGDYKEEFNDFRIIF